MIVLFLAALFGAACAVVSFTSGRPLYQALGFQLLGHAAFLWIFRGAINS